MKSYGDRVILVQKDRDGNLRRTNAIVLASSQHAPLTFDRKPALDGDGKPLPASEHLDLAFPVATQNGQAPKTRSMDEVFRISYDAGPWVDGGWIGWEEATVVPSSPSTADPEAAARASAAKDHEIEQLQQDRSDLTLQLAAANAKIAELTPPPDPAS